MASYRFALWGAQLVVAASLVAVALLSRASRAQEDDPSKRICALSENQTNAAIAAFARLMPVFHHDRCANCHRKIDPFAPRGHVDIREELARYRDRRIVAIAARDTTVDVDRAHAAIGRYLDGGPLSPSDQNTMMFSNACSVCHDPPPETQNWRMPPPPDSFHDKDARKLCRHIHTNDLTNTPADFEHHMRDDEFIKVGFKGTRGLNGLGEAISADSTRAPYAKKPIHAPNHRATMGNVRDWLTAQRNEFSPNPDCGCRPFRYALEWSAQWDAAIARRRANLTGGAAARTKIPLTFKDDGSFSGEGSVTLVVDIQTQSRADNCTVRGESRMTFRINGRVTQNETMEIEGVTEETPKPTTVTCQTRDGPFSYSAPASGAGQTFPFALALKAEVGARVRKVHSGPGSTVTLDVILVEDR